MSHVVSVPGGEVRVTNHPPTAKSFEVELTLDGETLISEQDWEPRDTRSVLWAGLSTWTKPARPISEDEAELLLDALWAAAKPSVKFIAQVNHDLKTARIRRWHRGPRDRGLIEVKGDWVDYLELGRTLRVGYMREPGTQPRTAVVKPPAEWLLPERRPVTDDEWQVAIKRMERASPDDFVLCDAPWRIREAEA